MKQKLLIGAIIFQIIILFGMLCYAYAPIYFGKEIRVGVRLYDPRDFLRGNYVKLTYDFSSLQLDSVQEYELSKGKKIYALLTADSTGYYHFEKHTLTKPKTGVFLAGRYDGYEAEFGVEAFFLPVEKAKEMEDQLRDSATYAVLSVMSSGKARIKEIKVDKTEQSASFEE